MNTESLTQRHTNGSTPIRVIMADPDVSRQPMYRDHLAQEGFEVVAAASGLECMAQMRERVPDVLVLEPLLPWGNGDGVLAVMGDTPALAAVPVMVLTSCRNPQVMDRMARFPISDYQLKPLSPERLAIRLYALLAHPIRFTLAEQDDRLQSSIARRTGDRVRDLHVETVAGRVIVHGRSDSHHVKQLALAAVLDAFEASESQSERVELDIEVLPDGNWQAERCELSGKENWNYADEFDLTKEN